MPRIISLTAVGLLVLLLCTPAIAQDRAVNLDYVYGTTRQDTIMNANAVQILFIRFTNNSATKYNISNGFKLYSPDGAHWSETEADTFAQDLSVPLSRANFSFGSAIFKYSLDGEGHDTVGFFAQGLSTNPLLPAGFDGQIGSITLVGVRAEDWGLHLCIDTVTFFPPGGAWKWVNQLDQQYPTWNTSGTYHTVENHGGPICFRIEDCCDCGMGSTGPSTLGPCEARYFNFSAPLEMDIEEWQVTVIGSELPAEIDHENSSTALVKWASAASDAGDLITITMDGWDHWGCHIRTSRGVMVQENSPCIGRTGNVDFLGVDPNEVDSSDLGVLVSFLFNEPGLVPLCSQGEADVDAQGGENPIDSSDLGLLVGYLFSPPGTVTLPDCL